MKVNKTILIGFSVLCLIFSSGCQIIPAVLEKMFPKEKVPPKFVLPKDKIVLIFPDDFQNPVTYPPIKRRLAKKIADTLIERKVITKMVDYDKLQELENNRDDFNILSIPKIGELTGAGLVIYVSIDQFSLKDSPVDTLWRGRISCTVKVVDVKKGRIWPDESGGYPLKVVEPQTDNASESYGVELANKLADDLAEKICDLFSAHYVLRSRMRENEGMNAHQW